ncbi:unnamed protein product, partial [Iphiclides podalirius]
MFPVYAVTPARTGPQEARQKAAIQTISAAAMQGLARVVKGARDKQMANTEMYSRTPAPGLSPMQNKTPD